MKLLLIVNTSASSVTPRARVVIHKTLSAAHDVQLRETNRRGHAARLAQGAVADGMDAVVVLGGDGTLNEAANGLAGTDVALAILPGGSTNVFARTIGMANDAMEATAQVLDALAAGSVSRAGLGVANGRYFLFHVGIGFDASVVARVERMSKLKRYTGPLVFVMATVYTWLTGYDRRLPHFDIRAGGTDVPGCFFAICLNTSPYTYFGHRPLDIAPGASLSSTLSLVTFQKLTLRTVLPVATAALAGRPSAKWPQGVGLMERLDAVTVDCRRPVPYQLDGDLVGDVECLELAWEPDVIRLVLPLPPKA